MLVNTTPRLVNTTLGFHRDDSKDLRNRRCTAGGLGIAVLKIGVQVAHAGIKIN